MIPQRLLARCLAGALFLAAALDATAVSKITPAKDLIGFGIGDDYHVASYTQMSKMLLTWEKESDKLKVVNIGKTEEGRDQLMAIVSSPANLGKLERLRNISQTLSHAEVSEEQARALAKEGKAVVWIDGGLHATETVNSQSLVELVYQLITKDDDETQRILDDTITILPVPNPDGVEMVAEWYMRPSDPKQRTLLGLPRLYEKYAGHDNNRDAIIHNLKETINQNKVLYIDWNPQLMLNVHQSGPAGTIVFIPPFRDPFNYNFDPLIPIGIEQVGSAIHARLIAQGKGGSVMRSAALYSTWANGGIRYATYFRNQIGLLTEIVGNPTPMKIPLLPDRQLPTGDGPLPIAPQLWHYRQSIDYQIEIGLGLLDYASRHREQLLFNIYSMGRNSIEKGSRDSWTISPKRIAALKEAAKAESAGEVPSDNPGSPYARGISPELYRKVLRDPAFRDPRGFVIPSDQPDFPTAVKFVNALLKGGIDVLKATEDFSVNGKAYKAGSYVVKTAQAFRPAVLDSFEPLDHPTDLEYPGGPPKRPYDIAGWTLAAQMGVEFDRVYEGFDGPFRKLPFELETPPPADLAGAKAPVGYLVSHRLNDSIIVTNRLLKAGLPAYWLKEAQSVDGQTFAPGALWVPASPEAKALLQQAAKELGVPAFGLAAKPAGEASKLQPVRIGLADVYGGSMPSGWTRFLLERFEFPYELVFPKELDGGRLKEKFDVIILPSGIYGEAARRSGPPRIDEAAIPDEYRFMLGSVSAEKTAPALKSFAEEGGTLVAVGTSAWIGKALGIPLEDHLATPDDKGAMKRLPSSKFYVPGSVLKASFDNKSPLGYGLPETGFVFFQDSPVFNYPKGTPGTPVAWFSDKEPLYSGWAIGQNYLEGGDIALDVTFGKGKVALLGLEATFRATPHATFKLLFNSIYLESSNKAGSL